MFEGDHAERRPASPEAVAGATAREGESGV